LNAPSSKSIYAYPLKKCIIAPPKRVVYTADLAAGEDRWMANLSGDKNKQSIFLENLDGHSLNSCVYFEEEIAEIMGPVPKDHDMRMEYIREFYAHADGDDKVLKKIRFNSKAPTFKLAYGGYPDADKGGVITQEIFDNYHNVLYPGITRYREKYVLPITKQQGYIHLGLGCRIYSSKPDQAIRTLNNATVQFWSILVMIAINELNYRIREENLQDAMDVTSTIYDSIYLSVVKDSEIIAWLNENIIELMTVQWLEEETIRNEACGEIGLNWADLHRVNNHATPAEIADILEQL
jgi:DNA polymerase-1